MVEKRKDVRRGERLLKQIGICSKPSVTKSDHDKENGDVNSKPLATSEPLTESEPSCSDQSRISACISARRSSARLKEYILASENKVVKSEPPANSERPAKSEPPAKSKPTSSDQSDKTAQKSLRRRQKLLASLGAGPNSNSTNCKAISKRTVDSNKSVKTDQSKLKVVEHPKEVRRPKSNKSVKPKQLKPKEVPSKDVEKPKPYTKPKRSRPRNQIKAKNPQLCEKSVLKLTPLKSLKAASSLGFIVEMSPMSFGTPAAKKKRSRKRDPMELSPTCRSKIYTSVWSRENTAEPAPMPSTSADTLAEQEDKLEIKNLKDILFDKDDQSTSEEEDEYFGL